MSKPSVGSFFKILWVHGPPPSQVISLANTGRSSLCRALSVRTVANSCSVQRDSPICVGSQLHIIRSRCLERPAVIVLPCIEKTACGKFSWVIHCYEKFSTRTFFPQKFFNSKISRFTVTHSFICGLLSPIVMPFHFLTIHLLWPEICCRISVKHPFRCRISTHETLFDQ